MELFTKPLPTSMNPLPDSRILSECNVDFLCNTVPGTNMSCCWLIFLGLLIVALSILIHAFMARSDRRRELEEAKKQRRARKPAEYIQG